MDKLKYLSLFSGIGAFEMALKNIGIDYELVGFSEIDKYAIKSYCAVHDVAEDLNLGDITKININKLPKNIDIITHGSPCQSFSAAGLGKGGDKGSGTRSSLMWNTVEIVSHCKPKYVIWENVKNVLSKKHIHNFEQYLNELEELGYTNYYKVLNAKDYGVPQNRERIFVISILSDKIQYEFPEPIKLEKAIKDILEENIDDKYYLSEETVKKLVFKKCIESDSNKINQLGMLDIKGNEQIRRVYGDNPLSPTLNTMQGGNRQPKILEVGYIKKSENGTKHQSNTVIDEDGIMRTLTACDYKAPQMITYKGKEVELPCIAASRGRNPENISSRVADKKTEQNLEVNTQGTSNTITTVQKDNYVITVDDNIKPSVKVNYEREKEQIANSDKEIYQCKCTSGWQDNKVGIKVSPTLRAGNPHTCVYCDFRIRKLTPRECFRLMGVSDKDIDKIQQAGISNSQQYKQAGNSIVVNVLEAIFRNLFL